MTVSFEGTLAVQRITGVNGEFSVGKLETQEGIFSIKDPHLDQYETGKYAGRFLIDRIFPKSYMSRTNCVIVEIRAVVKEYIIHSDDPAVLDYDVGLTEQDPLETPSVVVPETAIPATTPPPGDLPQDLPARKFTPSKQQKPVIEANHEPEASQADGNPHPPLLDNPDASLAALFGELWPLADTVQLDSTTVRSDPVNHRKRTQYLKLQGYVFKATSQSWVKKSGNQEDVTVL
jgi:hypothetical protein